MKQYFRNIVIRIFKWFGFQPIAKAPLRMSNVEVIKKIIDKESPLPSGHVSFSGSAIAYNAVKDREAEKLKHRLKDPTVQTIMYREARRGEEALARQVELLSYHNEKKVVNQQTQPYDKLKSLLQDTKGEQQDRE